MFLGPFGCGKSTLARIAARDIGAEESDIEEYNFGLNGGVDTVREILGTISLAPTGTCRVFIMEEFHRASTNAQDGLLRVMEEPPAHVYFFIATTETAKILPTIKSRCTEFKVHSFDEVNMQKLLMRVCRKEKIELDDEVMDSIIDASLGSGRNALNILEQVSSLKDKKQQLEIIPIAAADDDKAFPLACAIFAPKGTPSWTTVSDYLKALEKEDPEKIRQLMLSFGSTMLLKHGKSQVYEAMTFFKEPFYVNGKALLTLACYEATKLAGS